MTDILIHIGYHKTGSKWLQNFLFNEPAVGFALPLRNQEILPLLVYPHALDFDPNICRKCLQLAAVDVRNRGLSPVLSSEELSGNPHSGGYASKELADRLMAVFPRAKILIVIREQQSMIASTYKQYVKIGGTCSLMHYLQPTACGRQRIPSFDWEHFKYHRLIKYYLSLFGHSQVLVLPYELFLVDPMRFISQIIRFCELDIKAEVVEALPYTIKKNGSLSGISIALKRHVNGIVGHRDRLNPRVLIPVTLHTSCQKLNSYWQTLDSLIPPSFKRVSDRRLKILVRKLTGDRYTQSNSLTSNMLDLNLSQYGYDL